MPLQVEGREIVDSGSAVLAPSENSVTITLGDLRFQVVWEKDSRGPNRVLASDIGLNAVRMRLINADNSLGATYTVDSVGTFMGKQLGMALFWHSVEGDAGTSRLFAYMLTVR